MGGQTGEGAGREPRVDSEHPAAHEHEQPGPVSPFAGTERALRRPLTVGFALLLVLANVIGWTWFVQRQDEQYAMLQSQLSAVDVSLPPVGADPALCWLVGASARAAGHADAFIRATGDSGVIDACDDAAVRGARGYGR